MGFWIFRIQAHPCHLTANSPPSLQPFVSARCPTPVAYSLPHCFVHVLYPFVPISLRVLTCSSADRIFKPQFCRSADYEISNGFLHSSQFTVHSSQLTACSSQLTPRLFRFLVDRLIPATEPSKRPSEKLIRFLSLRHTKNFFLWCPWTNLSKPPSTKHPRVTSRQNMKRTRHIPMQCFQRTNFQIKFQISVHAQVVLAGYPLLQWPLFVLATMCFSLLL
jgi:hypothetical protein